MQEKQEEPIQVSKSSRSISMHYHRLYVLVNGAKSYESTTTRFVKSSSQIKMLVSASDNIHQVYSICGSLASEFDIKLDLEITDSVDETICRIFEGRAVRKLAPDQDMMDASQSILASQSAFPPSTSLSQELNSMHILSSSHSQGQNVVVVKGLLDSDSEDSDCMIIDMTDSKPDKPAPRTIEKKQNKASFESNAIIIDDDDDRVQFTNNTCSSRAKTRTESFLNQPANLSVSKNRSYDSDDDELPLSGNILAMPRLAANPTFVRPVTSATSTALNPSLNCSRHSNVTTGETIRKETVQSISLPESKAPKPAKTEKQLARQALKEQEEAEKRLKKAHKDANKIRQKDDCMREMVAVFSKEFMDLFPDLMDFISVGLDEAGGKCQICTMPSPIISKFPNLVQFKRRATRKFNSQNGVWVSCPEYEQTEPYVLLILHADNLADGIREEGASHLKNLYGQISGAFPGYKVLVLIEDLDQYAMKKKNAGKRQVNRSLRQEIDGSKDDGTTTTRTKRKKKTPAISLTSYPELFPEESEIDRQIFELQLSSNGLCRVHTCREQETPSWIVTYTEQIGVEQELRYRSHDSLQLAFGDNIKSGKNMLDQWNRMLCQIPGVTDVKALAVTETYPSLQKLIRAYERASSVESARNLLIGLRPRNHLTASAIGSAISHKVYDQLMSRDPKVSAM